MPRLMDMHAENAKTGLTHAPKTANINEKRLNSLQHHIRTTAAKSQN